MSMILSRAISIESAAGRDQIAAEGADVGQPGEDETSKCAAARSLRRLPFIGRC